MLLARIVGTVVATRKDPRLVSNKLFVARGVDPRGKADGAYLVAIDTVDAGVGETVLIVSGSSARMASGLKDCPVDAAIVGIVDEVSMPEKPLYQPPGQSRRRCGRDEEGRNPRRREAADRAADRARRPGCGQAAGGHRRRRRRRG